MNMRQYAGYLGNQIYASNDDDGTYWGWRNGVYDHLSNPDTGNKPERHMVGHLISNTRGCCSDMACGFNYKPLEELCARAIFYIGRIRNPSQAMYDNHVQGKKWYIVYEVEKLWADLFEYSFDMPQRCPTCKLVYLHDLKVVAEFCRQNFRPEFTGLGSHNSLVRLEMLMQQVHKLPHLVVRSAPLWRLVVHFNASYADGNKPLLSPSELASTEVWYTPHPYELEQRQKTKYFGVDPTVNEWYKWAWKN